MPLTKTQRESAARFSKNIYEQLEQELVVTLDEDDAGDVAEILAVVAAEEE